MVHQVTLGGAGSGSRRPLMNLLTQHVLVGVAAVLQRAPPTQRASPASAEPQDGGQHQASRRKRQSVTRRRNTRALPPAPCPDRKPMGEA